MKSMESTVPLVVNADPPSPDRALVSRARSNEREAREELARRAGRSAYVFALQLTGRPDAAHDIAQESLLRFFEHLDRFDPGRPVEPWLFGIVRNRVRDAARREKLRRHESLDAWLEQGGAGTEDPSADPAVIAERHELRRQVWRAISDLGEAHRETLVLRDYHGLAYREIAEVLGIPMGTVMSRLHAARRQLRVIFIARRDAHLGAEETRRSDR